MKAPTPFYGGHQLVLIVQDECQRVLTWPLATVRSPSTVIAVIACSCYDVKPTRDQGCLRPLMREKAEKRQRAYERLKSGRTPLNATAWRPSSVLPESPWIAARIPLEDPLFDALQCLLVGPALQFHHLAPDSTSTRDSFQATFLRRYLHHRDTGNANLWSATFLSLLSSVFLFLSISTMTDKLPPNLLALFAPRPPLRWVEPPDYAPEKRKTAPIGGLVSFLPALEEYKQTDVYHPTESWLQRRDRKKQEKVEAVEALKTEAPKTCEILPQLYVQLRHGC